LAGAGVDQVGWDVEEVVVDEAGLDLKQARAVLDEVGPGTCAATRAAGGLLLLLLLLRLLLLLLLLLLRRGLAMEGGFGTGGDGGDVGRLGVGGRREALPMRIRRYQRAREWSTIREDQRLYY
jgi:hypothetical protein